ncbi:hypothetical protein [Paenibacillus senegalimassiliensis]|uniref:hypothetical protein n=1 Tax=Paenibacillus senegalimassiliensis TaxID=1737426 RepID=UPI00073E8679|nr:hypothetical protein [Paenibacillus senegalimassiliensis]
MKKWSYIIGGFILGIFVTISSDVAFAEVQSLIGKKVTGEMNVVVNGEALQTKGAVIQGTTNAPVRALSNALDANLKVEGNTIYINSTVQEGEKAMFEGNEYTKEELLKIKQKTENRLNVTIPETEEKNKKRYDSLIESGMNENAKKLKEANDKEIAESKEKSTEQLRRINEALKEFE